jgi:hypothetical protein
MKWLKLNKDEDEADEERRELPGITRQDKSSRPQSRDSALSSKTHLDTKEATTEACTETVTAPVAISLSLWARDVS